MIFKSDLFNFFFPPIAKCYGDFAQYRFRCFLGELGRFREGTGFWEPVPGTSSGNRIGFLRWVPTGFAVPRFRFRRLRKRGFEGSEGLDFISEVLIKPILVFGFQEPGILKRFRTKVSACYSVFRKYTFVL